MAQVLEGKSVNQQILDELKPRIAALAARGRAPGLTVILAGDHPASEIYVRNKVKTCRELGMLSEQIRLPASVTTAELVAHIDGAEQTPGDRRDPGADARAAAGGQPRRAAGRRPGQGRGRLPSLQRRPTGGQRARPALVHAGRRDGDSAALRYRCKGHERGRGRAERHRGQTDGADAAASECDGNDLPFAHAGSKVGVPKCRSIGCGHR